MTSGGSGRKYGDSGGDGDRGFSKVKLNIQKLAVPPDETTSVPGILRFKENTAPTSKMLDVRFYTTPNTPPQEEVRPFDPDEDRELKERHRDLLESNYMKELMEGYETRGKWDYYAHLEDAEEEKRNRKLQNIIKMVGPDVPHCGSDDEVDITQSKADLFQEPLDIKNQYWAKIFDKPSTTVTQSAFIAILEKEIKSEIARCGCVAPVYEMNKIYDDIRHGRMVNEALLDTESMDEYISVQDSLEEPEERLVARLKIYRRALSAIILHFKNLRPILRAIKINYDGILGLRERQLHDIKLLQNNVGYTERCYDIRIAKVRGEGYYQLCETEKRCFLLLRHVDKQDGAIRTMVEILNNLESSLEEEKSLKTASEEKRKKLIMEINDLRRQITETARILGQDAAMQAAAAADEEQGGNAAEEDLASVNDAGVLRNALENTRKTLSETHYRLTILEADYSDVIPKAEFQLLEGQMKEAQDRYKGVKDDYDHLSSQVQNLRDQIDSLIADRDDLQELVQSLQFKATPRPSWSKIAEFVEGGITRWQEIYQGKSSKQIVDQVVEVLTGKKVGQPPEFIQPLGTAESVPLYLRYDQPVRQRNFTRRDCAVLIHDIQQTRMEHLEVVRKIRESQDDDYAAPEHLPTILPFLEFVTNYFKERLPWANLRAEYCYNLTDGCRQFSDHSLKTFLGMLEGRIDECVIHQLRNDIAKVRNVLIEKSAAGGHSMGSLPASEFPGAMRESFPQKTDEEIKALVQAASKQTGAVADWFLMKYVSFFVMTDEGLVGDFIEEVVKQFDADRLEYIYEILNVLLSELGVSLQSAERENDPAGETDVSMQQMYHAITAVDPNFPEEKIAAAMAWIFFGESTLPGLPPKGLPLVRFLQEHSRKISQPDADSDEEDDADDDEFERCVEEIRKRDGASMLDENGAVDMDEKKRKAKLKKLKVLPLRTVVVRLKGSCLFRLSKKMKPGSPSATESLGKSSLTMQDSSRRKSSVGKSTTGPSSNGSKPSPNSKPK